MSNFRSLQARHEELIQNVQKGQLDISDVEQFIQDAKTASSQIGAASERDQLRSNLRYWASYLYEQTQTYPNVDLAPSIVVQRSGWVLPVVIAGGVLLVLYFLGRLFLNTNNPPATEPSETGAPAATEAPASEAPATEPPVTEEPGLLPTAETGNSISIQILSVRDGDVVSPITEVSGTYSNLLAGSSIHVLVQPLSEGGVRYPAKKYASVAANFTSGTWAIETQFGQGEELKEKEDYLIFVVAATGERARQALVAAAEDGLRELPEGVIPFPQTVSVQRAGFSVVIDRVRLIYSSYLEDEGNFEIFSSELDGTDPRRITYTSAVSELFPSLSQDGKQITYIGRMRDENRSPIYSLEFINSDGTSPTVLIEPQKEFIFETPRWSSDGALIAYAVGDLSAGGQPPWDIAVFDIQADEPVILMEGNTFGPRYFTWIPGTDELIYNARITEVSGTSGFRKIDIAAPDRPDLFFDDRGEELQPSLSEDGTRLAYMQLDSGIGNIYIANLTDGSITPLTEGQFTASLPALAPDGGIVFFQFYVLGDFNIWSVDVASRTLTQLTSGTQVMYPYAGYMYALVP